MRFIQIVATQAGFLTDGAPLVVLHGLDEAGQVWEYSAEDEGWLPPVPMFAVDTL